ncbi:DUF4055 domain-containing protein [bacterium]|nr:DUF4055 domain-containing protein [bacterium]
MAAVSNDNRVKGVGDPTAQYLSLKPIWDKNRAVCSGEQYVKSYDGMLRRDYSNLLIPFSPSMTQPQYDFYRAEAELPGIVSQYVNMIVGGLLRKKPILDLPDSVPDGAKDWLLNEFGKDKSAMTAFLEDALSEEVQTNSTWVYLSYPNVKHADRLDKKEREKFRPTPSLLRAETVVNTRTGENAYGDIVLKHLIVRGFTYEYKEDEFHPTPVETVWIHRLDAQGLYEILVYKLDGQSSQTVVSGETHHSPESSAPVFLLKDTYIDIKMNGERLKFIPAWPLDGNLDPSDPAISPLVDKEISLYNKVSRRNHLLYGAATYTPVISSDMSEEKFEDVVSSGLGSWLQLRQGDTATILDTPTDALADMDRAISNGIEEMAKLGIRMLTPETNQSGVALEIRNAAQTAQLGTLNTRVSNTIRAIIAVMLEWRYGEAVSVNDIEFTLSADFNPVPIGADWLRLATEWYQQGLIPRNVWLMLLKQNDMVPADYDDEEGIQEINDDELIMPDSSDPKDDFEDK